MKDMTQGSVIGHLLSMAAFMAVSMLAQTLYLLADLYWVGHLGKEAIAAVGVAGNLDDDCARDDANAQRRDNDTDLTRSGRQRSARAELVFNQSFTMSIVVALGLGVWDFFCATSIATA